MLKRTHFHVITILLLLIFPALALANYKIVVKKNGKIIEGDLISEDDVSITIVSSGARLSYKKDQLDLDRMKQLNAGYIPNSGVKTVLMPDKSGANLKKKSETSLADVAKQTQPGHSKDSATTSDANEKSLAEWVQELEDKANVTPSQRTEIQLSKARKALTYYRARNERQFSETDRRLMLEQLVNALEFAYTKELEAGAPDDKTAALKKKIEETKQELASLD